ncbi:UvrD-helicase domain-containing protein [Methylophilaceae bacterium]|nr:UvrD-helicase domain-containing protein [Methylophilaceae bacterium]
MDKETKLLIDKLLRHWIKLSRGAMSGPRSRTFDYYQKHLLGKVVPAAIKDLNTSFLENTEKFFFGQLKNKLTINQWTNLESFIVDRFKIMFPEAEELEEIVQDEPNYNNFLNQGKPFINDDRDDNLKNQPLSNLKEIIKNQRSKIMDQIKDKFKSDFLNSTYNDDYKKYKINNKEYESEKIKFVKSWIRNNLDEEVDDSQARALSSNGGNIQVIARAGSGKTKTIINRVIFLNKHCGVGLNKIIILAFNKKAVEEIQERLKKYFKNRTPSIMTFHALANRLVNPSAELLTDEKEDQMIVQSIIKDYLLNDQNKNTILSLMLNHFRDDLDTSNNEKISPTKEDYLIERKLLNFISLNNDYVKSKGEKLIADFLFQNNVKYKYEKVFFWAGVPYHPDFTISKGIDSGVVIEFFGMAGDKEYDIQTKAKIKYWQEKDNWDLIAIYPSQLSGTHQESLSFLRCQLDFKEIDHKQLSDEEIWDKIEPRIIMRFTIITFNFIKRCRKQSLLPEDLFNKIKKFGDLNDKETKFNKIILSLYEEYLKVLSNQNKLDYEGLLHASSESINKGQTIWKNPQQSGDLRELEYIFIDEFQDFNELFYKIITAVKSQNKNVELFCVGDNWQAINGFAGSDTKFISHFDQYFRDTKYLLNQKYHLLANYRSSKSIVSISNKLMKKLEDNPAIPVSTNNGIIQLAYLEKFKQIPYEIEEHTYPILSAAIRIVSNIIYNSGLDIVILSRTKRIPGYHPKSESKDHLKEFRSEIIMHLDEKLKNKVLVSTVHSYKGMESDVVVVIDAKERNYPLIHPDWVFNKVLGETIEELISSERKLFYVAMTRAKKRLIILTSKSEESPFLEEIFDKNSVNLDWKNYPITPNVYLKNKVYIYVSKGNSHSLRSDLKDDNFKFNLEDSRWFKILNEQEYSSKVVTNSKWTHKAINIILLVKKMKGSKVTIEERIINEGKFKRPKT